MLTIDNHPIQMAFIPSPSLTPSNCVSIALLKLENPLMDGLISICNSLISSQLFDIKKNQGDTNVLLHCTTDYLDRIFGSFSMSNLIEFHAFSQFDKKDK